MKAIVVAYREAFGGLPRAVWLLSFAAFVNRAGTMVLPFLGLYLVSERGLSAAQAGLLISAYGVGSLAGGYLGGWASDRIPALWVQVASLLLTGFGYFAMGFVPGTTSLAVVIVVTGLVAEAFRPANLVVLSSVCAPETRTRSIILHRLAINLGMGIGPSAGGLLAHTDYRWLFAIDAITGWVAAVILWRAFAPTRPPPPEPGAVPDRSPFRDGPFMLALVGCFGIGLIFFQETSTFPLYLQAVYALDEMQIGLVIGVNAVLIVLVEMVLLHRLREQPPLKVIAIGAALLGVGFGAVPFGRGFLYAALTVVPWTLGEMLTLSLLTAFVTDRAGERSRGRYLGIYTQTFGAAFVLGPMIGTFLYGEVGRDLVWYACLVVGLLSGLVFYALSRIVPAVAQPSH